MSSLPENSWKPRKFRLFEHSNIWKIVRLPVRSCEHRLLVPSESLGKSRCNNLVRFLTSCCRSSCSNNAFVCENRARASSENSSEAVVISACKEHISRKFQHSALLGSSDWRKKAEETHLGLQYELETISAVAIWRGGGGGDSLYAVSQWPSSSWPLSGCPPRVMRSLVDLCKWDTHYQRWSQLI